MAIWYTLQRLDYILHQWRCLAPGGRETVLPKVLVGRDIAVVTHTISLPKKAHGETVNMIQ